eukprot:427573_1
MMQNIKCVVVGDSGVGKTCLLIRYTTQCFPGEYIPTVFDNYALSTLAHGKRIQLGLWDTYDDPDGYDRLRYLSYPQTHIFLICYSVISKRSMDHIISKWIPEVRQHVQRPNVPFIIIGTKTDLRNDENVLNLISKNDTIVTFRDGNIMAIQNGADDFIEVSALMDKQEDINDVFTQAINSALMQQQISFPTFEYCMLNSEENKLLFENRKRFHKFKIYDIHTFIFNLFCLLIDILITIVYAIILMQHNDSNETYLMNVFNTFVYYQLWICIVPVICVVEFKYILHLIREEILCDLNIIYYISIAIIFIPIAIWIAVFINISYFLHCFVFNKCHVSDKNKFNSI